MSAERDPGAEARAGLGRADWRFLLPAPAGTAFEHLVILGGPPELPGLLLEAGSAARVTPTVPAGGGVDALAILAGARVRFEQAVRCLRPNGVLYLEIDRRASGNRGLTPGRLRRRLSQCGLSPTGLYWVIPSFAEARRFLPLDHPAVVDWFFETRFVADSPFRRLLELGALIARRLGVSVPGALVPTFAVTAVASAQADRGIVALADPVLPPQVRATGCRAALFTSGQDGGSRVVVVPFPANARRPEVVLKVARLSAFTGHSRREQATLTQLRGRLDPVLARTLPEPLGEAAVGAGTAFLESAMAGRVLAASTAGWSVPRGRRIADLRLAAEWLARFHQQTLVQRAPWDSGMTARWIDEPRARWIRVFGHGASEARLFAAVRRRAEEMGGHPIPTVWLHNDFNPAHVYRLGSAMGVIDWEFGPEDMTGRHGLPLCDLAYFAVHWHRLVRRLRGEPAQLEGFRELVFGAPERHPYAAAVRTVMADYMLRLDIHPGFLPVLLLQTWVERALDRHARRASLDLVAAPRAHNPFVRYVEILAEGTNALMGESAPSTRPTPASTTG
jgi:aminoglycoside phosphotransferase (APT) family kinase protein